MANFLAENNACGQNLLDLVARGNILIAEILRLKDYIPDIYRLENSKDREKYADIIMDFSYLKYAKIHEEKILQNPMLQELDDDIRTNYLDLLARFYLIFQSTHQYFSDLKQFIHELNHDYYIQHTLESVLQDGEGKQLLCESLYIFGVILLIMDFHIPGLIRERLLISYYRYSGVKTFSDSNVDDVCMLLRSTDYIYATTVTATNTKSSKDFAISNYPEKYFGRCQFDENFVEMIISRLRCDDIYNQLKIYPHHDHRTIALANQAAMLYVCLYFAPNILHTQIVLMREIVDKFFCDNWYVSIYMGITINLCDAWEGFNAAKNAISSIIEHKSLKRICLLHKEQLQKAINHSNDLLHEGILNDYYILQNLSKIILLLRQCNVLLRWYCLHTVAATNELNRIDTNAYGNSNANVKQTHRHLTRQSLVCNLLDYQPLMLFNLLMNTARLELHLKENIRILILERVERWQKCQNEALNHINELKDAFASLRPLTKIASNEQLHLWFQHIAEEIAKLDINQMAASNRILIQLIQALEEVEEFHNLQSNMQVKQYLLEARDYLTKMIQIIGVQEDILITIQLISDLSYGWILIDRDFTGIMQANITTQPKSVKKLRTVFLKMASSLEIPLMRINQAKSTDLQTVSTYYSNELAKYIRKVMQIIPANMFNILSDIIDLQTNVLKEMPKRLDKSELRDYMQLDARYTLAKHTQSIAEFTEGILLMQTTLVGVIELDPQQLLEDGLRRELVNRLSKALHNGLMFAKQSTVSTMPSITSLAATSLPSSSSFSTSSSSSSSAMGKQKLAMQLETKLEELIKIMEGYRRSFEYIQDYLNVDGLRILQEELTRIINFNVENECNALAIKNSNATINKSAIFHNATNIPIPTYTPIQNDGSCANNFIGRLAYQILQCTDPYHTIYVELKSSWYEIRSPFNKILISRRFFSQLRHAMGPVSLVGLDRLYANLLTNSLNEILTKLQNNLVHDEMWSKVLQQLYNELEAKALPEAYSRNPLKFYTNYQQLWLKVWPKFLDWCLGLGNKQIIRQQIAIELNRSSKCNAKNLESVLETFNKSLLNELEDEKCRKKLSKSDLFLEVNDYLSFVGIYDPYEQIFVNVRNNCNVALFFALFTLAHLARLLFPPKHLSNATTTTAATANKLSKDGDIDGIAFIVGLVTILQQYHSNIRIMYISYLCQFIIYVSSHNLRVKQDLCMEVLMTVNVLENFVRLSKLPRSLLTNRLPIVLLDLWDMDFDST